ncbi:MAG: phosphatase PAP2 family protein [Polyangiaceae bacterium]
MDLDHRLLLAVYGGMHGAWALPMVALSILGSGWSATTIVPLLAWARTRRFALALAAAVVLQSAIVWALKRVVGRVRPWLALGLAPPFGVPHDGSFPSGHAAGSFCVAAYLVVSLRLIEWPGSARLRPATSRRAERAGRQAAALALAGIAAMIALSRVYLGAHFPSDVVAGAVLGGTIGAGAARFGGTRA